MKTDEELLANGGSEAMALLMERYQSLYGYLVRELRDPHEAEDLLQEVMLRVWRNRKKFRGDSSVRIWLFCIARNLVIDHVRRKVPVPVETIPAAELKLVKSAPQEADQFAIGNELNRSIEKAIRALPEELRETFCLIRFDGLRYRDAASVIGVSEGSVKMRMIRAMRKLRESLSPDWEAENGST